MAYKAKLKCKSFGWYLREIYPELTVPEKTKKHFTLKHNKLCLDSMGLTKTQGASPGIFPCHGTGGNQEWVLHLKDKTIQPIAFNLCLEADSVVSKIFYKPCSSRSKWNYEERTGLLQSNGKCVSVVLKSDRDFDKEEYSLRMVECDTNDERQKWVFEELKG